jgi:hypothetical protein
MHSERLPWLTPRVERREAVNLFTGGEGEVDLTNGRTTESAGHRYPMDDNRWTDTGLHDRPPRLRDEVADALASPDGVTCRNGPRGRPGP